MKAKRIRKLRNKILSDGYYEKRWDKLSQQCRYWDSFNTFECSSFFRGEERARFNQYLYDKTAPRLNRKSDYYYRKICEQSCDK